MVEAKPTLDAEDAADIVSTLQRDIVQHVVMGKVRELENIVGRIKK